MITRPNHRNFDWATAEQPWTALATAAGTILCRQLNKGSRVAKSVLRDSPLALFEAVLKPRGRNPHEIGRRPPSLSVLYSPMLFVDHRDGLMRANCWVEKEESSRVRPLHSD